MYLLSTITLLFLSQIVERSTVGTDSNNYIPLHVVRLNGILFFNNYCRLFAINLIFRFTEFQIGIADSRNQDAVAAGNTLS